ncbi:hypothetical protein H9P43_009315 [Blastocladiella emersonii ATCC 22665]|nr:hypothetical protein H9P43_009315 [Blastocladiella emersonii ATCC 22665]
MNQSSASAPAAASAPTNSGEHLVPNKPVAHATADAAQSATAAVEEEASADDQADVETQSISPSDASLKRQGRNIGLGIAATSMLFNFIPVLFPLIALIAAAGSSASEDEFNSGVCGTLRTLNLGTLIVGLVLFATGFIGVYRTFISKNAAVPPTPVMAKVYSLLYVANTLGRVALVVLIIFAIRTLFLTATCTAVPTMVLMTWFWVVAPAVLAAGLLVAGIAFVAMT